MDGGLPVVGDFCWRFPVSIFSLHHHLPNQLIIITITQFLNLNNNNRIFNNHLIFQHRNKMELAQLVLVELEIHTPIEFKCKLFVTCIKKKKYTLQMNSYDNHFVYRQVEEEEEILQFTVKSTSFFVFGITFPFVFGITCLFVFHPLD
ncbi:unnamed protein product [Trifolium pratense]|uniref:Uncharacterized protein n=1 Tax=Trifolium pratense TaxID=57577 RepID=A0ACB0LYA4_TRIPR|nr:unnamed protein product [Trifolium pratense]